MASATLPTLPTLPWRKLGVESGPLRLTSRRLYILPTRSGLVFSLLLLGLLVGAINYGVSLVYLFTFWFVGLGVVAMLHTHRNLSGLVLQSGAAMPVFAGETACFKLRVANPSRLPRQRIGLRHAQGQGKFDDITGGGEMLLELPLPQLERGWKTPGQFAIHSEFPLGLFRCWTVLELDWGVLVYPRPAADTVPLPAADFDDGEGNAARGEGLEFDGLRVYQPGDASRRIAWKASARGGDKLLTKQFSSSSGKRLWLSWWQTQERDVESRLSRLTRWVLDAHTAGLAYGLKLPGRTLPPQTGETHLRQCLEALARHGQA
ncbi:MAG: DUF58 domain-containing protein [Gallionellaceae bacterium]|nr:DUF58 domain-containing protein [Gallionellaceae bacterium]